MHRPVWARAATRDVLISCKTLVVAGLGAGLFVALSLPLPWLLGAAVMVGIVGRRTTLRIASPVRHAALVALGLQIGSALTPETANRIAQLPMIALGLAAATISAMAMGYLVYRRAARWDPQTAFLAAAPGALSYILVAAQDARVDMGRVMMAQALRLGVLIVVVPLAFSSTAPAASDLDIWTPPEAVIATAAGVSAAAALHAIRAPVAWLVGPAVAAAGLALAGVNDGSPHPFAFNASLVVLGAVAATGMGGGGGAPHWRRDLGVIVLGTTVMLGAALAVAWMIAHIAAVAFPALALAYAPGGFEVMIALAAALALEPALVGAAHVVRILALIVVLPPLFARLAGPRADSGPPATNAPPPDAGRDAT